MHWFKAVTASLHYAKFYQTSDSTNDQPIFIHCYYTDRVAVAVAVVILRVFFWREKKTNTLISTNTTQLPTARSWNSSLHSVLFFCGFLILSLFISLFRSRFLSRFLSFLSSMHSLLHFRSDELTQRQYLFM